MHQDSAKDPLHGITLEQLLIVLVEEYGWRELARQVPIRCLWLSAPIGHPLLATLRLWLRAAPAGATIFALPRYVMFDPIKSLIHRASIV